MSTNCERSRKLYKLDQLARFIVRFIDINAGSISQEINYPRNFNLRLLSRFIDWFLTILFIVIELAYYIEYGVAFARMFSSAIILIALFCYINVSMLRVYSLARVSTFSMLM